MNSNINIIERIAIKVAVNVGLAIVFISKVFKSQVDNYYQKFKDEGANVLKTAIGSVKDPHGNLPIYKEIGKEIDNLL
jgi:hypothetical protein